MGKHLLTNDEVAELLRMEPRTVRRWARAGRFPGAIVLPTGDVRFDTEVLEMWLSEQAKRGRQ